MELSQDQIRQLLQGISVPPQPQIMVDLQMEQLDPNCSMPRIAHLISQDVGLAGSILKTVNSPFYALDHKIASIDQAINILGIKTVVNIINALSIRGELSDDAIIALGRFWDSATDIASTCAAIARHVNFSAPDEAYTLGLFHNCGIPLMMRRFPEYANILEQTYGSPEARIVDRENELFNTNHAVVGYYVAKSWGLPGYLCEAIAEHHSTERLFADPDYPDHHKKNLLALLKMAEHICGACRVLANQDIDHEWLRIQEPLLIYLGLSEFDFLNLEESIQELGLASGQYIHR